MNRTRLRLVTAGLILAVVAILALLVLRNQLRVYREREAAAARARTRQAAAAERPVRARRALLQALRPVALTNCTMERFGEADDGGYLMCANLLGDAEAAYSYGIEGRDKWGCDLSTRLGVRVHQYDCFDTRQPQCPGDTVFHAECVGDTTKREDGRLFDTIERQLARNGDLGKHIVVKIDVEGAEWDTFLSLPEQVLSRIDQMAVEFHRVGSADEKYLAVVERLKRYFEIAHLHFNNFSCVDYLDPLPAWAYEVLFVNKRLARVDPSRRPDGLHPAAAKNNPAGADCQARF